jgi:hypothetical protein
MRSIAPFFQRVSLPSSMTHYPNRGMPGDIGWRFLNRRGFARQTPRTPVKSGRAGRRNDMFRNRFIRWIDPRGIHLRRKKRADLGIALIDLDADRRG